MMRYARIIAIGAALLSAACSVYTSSVDRDQGSAPQDAFIYGSFWASAEVRDDMTMGIVLDCRDGKRYMLRFLRQDPMQVFKVSPSTCTPTGTVLTDAQLQNAKVRPEPSWGTRELVFEPGKAYYLGDFTAVPGTVIEDYVYFYTPGIRPGRVLVTKMYRPHRALRGWELEKSEDKYQATTREFRAAYPKLAGVPTESQMIEVPPRPPQPSQWVW